MGLLLTMGASYGQYEFDWNSEISGPSHDDSRTIVESNNFLYTAGRIEGACEFKSGTVFSTQTSAGVDDIFIAKLDMDGNYIWVNSMGGTMGEQATDIAVGPAGDIYVTGFFYSDFDFDPGTGTAPLVNVGGRDVFIARFDPAGALVWVKQIAGTQDERAEGITVLSDGVVVTGKYSNTVDFDPGAGTANITSTGLNDAYIVKLDLNGDYMWVNTYGGFASASGKAITNDASDNIYVTGFFKDEIQFDPGNISTQFFSNGNNDIFVLKIDGGGNYLWGAAMGDFTNDIGADIQLDASNNIYVTGSFGGSVDFNPGAGDSIISSNSLKDAFIVKYDNNGLFQWANVIESDISENSGKGIAFDLADNVYQVGVFSGNAIIGGTPYTANGATDVFIHKMDQNGISLWSTTYGSQVPDFVNTIIIDADTSIYFNGKYGDNMDIDPTVADSTITASGIYDGCIFKWKLPDVLVTSITVQGQGGVSTIITQGGTLQMEATLLPMNATDPTYTWSVTNGSGSASIAVNGMLTAISDGIVTVTATANDGSGISGSTDITLSNQSVGLNEEAVSAISIYPNPSSNKLFVKNAKSNVSIKIYSLSGQEQQIVVATTNELSQIDISNLSKGVYFIHVGEQVQKFVKQ